MPRTHFDERWKAWLQHNVARGCSRDDLFRILLDEGFDFGAVQSELGHTPSIDLSLVRNRLRPAGGPDPRRLANLKKLHSPRIELFTAEDFLDAGECAALVEIIRARLRPSTISAPREPDAAFRTSSTCDLDASSSAAVARLDERICAAMQLDPEVAEPTQGQYYQVGQEFKPHTDYFESHELARYVTATLGQRSWTFMVYLNEPQGGGDTTFVSLMIRIRPKTGMAVIWNSLYPDGRPNPDTLHHGTPVRAGYKAIITKWFRTPL
jgi:prolyl 4-hydroxylase